MKKLLSLCLLLLCANSFAAPSQLDANKQLVKDFYKDIIILRNTELIDQYIGDTYIQHNPGIADGKQALVKAIKSWGPASDTAAEDTEIVRAIAEDDLVVLHVHMKAWRKPRGTALMDIFRVEDGKIVEHWDVIQAVPKAKANSNTMF